MPPQPIPMKKVCTSAQAFLPKCLVETDLLKLFR